jgi:hypothetical protein
MGTFNAFYVRKLAAEDATRTAILSLYPEARIQKLPDFFGAILSDDDTEPPEQRLAELSAKIATDVIWLGYQTTAVSFIFHHWRAGEQLRALWYGCASEGTWDRVEGQAEPWEAEEFWSKDGLEAALEYAEGEAESRKLRRLWKERVIHKGQSQPAAGSDDSVRAVMEHYNLFSDEAPLPPKSGAKEEKKDYGCLYVLLFIVVVFIFAIIGVVTVIKKLL